ncbi:hypothetical protein [Cerasicoccus fimbriatus]|uniref:hypothetical protein n=1 Tax=Cerasicoccus fimbriatus TaxID=3014554 RepID=UPI0022B4B209|nr:hypothetical protein [Cerasicoccus sp. TK19100]
MTRHQILILLVCITNFAHAQYFVEGEGDKSPHRLDQKYAGKLDFLEGNYVMEISIGEASTDWWAQMEATYQELVASLEYADARRLEISQKAWELAYETDRQFFFADPDLRLKIGREGEVLSKLEFMRRIRKRALDLAEYRVIFARSETP